MTEHARLPHAPPSTRQTVARDTLLILSGALLAIGASRVIAPDPAGSLSTLPPGDTGLFIGAGSEAPPATIPPLATLGRVVNPSVHLEATPTPIPIITLGPPTPTPSVEASPVTSGSARPSAKPTSSPKATPKPTPAPTKPPAGFTCVPTATADEITCTATVVNATSTYDWDWGDTKTGSGPTDVHLYQMDGCFVVSLTVTTPGGQFNSSSQQVVVSSATPPPTC